MYLSRDLCVYRLSIAPLLYFPTILLLFFDPLRLTSLSLSLPQLYSRVPSHSSRSYVSYPTTKVIFAAPLLSLYSLSLLYLYIFSLFFFFFYIKLHASIPSGALFHPFLSPLDNAKRPLAWAKKIALCCRTDIAHCSPTAPRRRSLERREIG